VDVLLDQEHRRAVPVDGLDHVEDPVDDQRGKAE
jgi:hypothetical protein